MTTDLLAQLQAALEPGLPVFVLIDPLLGEPLPLAGDPPDDWAALQAWREVAWQCPVFGVRLPAKTPLPVPMSPYLVQLHPLEDWLPTTLQLAADEWQTAVADGLSGDGQAAHRIGGWLQSPVDGAALADQLAASLSLRTVAHTRARYLRLADRRVLDWLRHVVGDARLLAQWPSLHAWHYLAPTGRIDRLRAGAGAHQPLQLSLDEWPRFMQNEHIQPTLARWLGQRLRDGAVLPPDPSTTAYPAIERALFQVTQLKPLFPALFRRPQDEHALAALSLLHPGTDWPQPLRRCLAAQPLDDLPTLHLHGLADTLHAQLA
ncbi:hypothetical protein [Chitinivorax sp. B]|uniref:hypothetical protein n=1 Tax=Chitinivorax sp. B TaxID=2502235 RepID=UPI0010FA04B9|nr:hypothetical protein [Chitinivorax sp. B]